LGAPTPDPGSTIDVALEDGTVRTVAYRDIDKARTVFEWGPEPKPNKAKPTKAKPGSGAAAERTAGDEPDPKQPKQPKKKKVNAS